MTEFINDMQQFWTIGEYLNPQPEDKLRPIGSLAEARDRALHRSNCFHNVLVAVWDSKDEILLLFVNGCGFTPMTK